MLGWGGLEAAGTERSGPPGCKPQGFWSAHRSPSRETDPRFLHTSILCASLPVSLPPCLWLLHSLELWGPSLPTFVTASQLFLASSVSVLRSLSLSHRPPPPLLIQRILTEPLPTLPRITLSKMREPAGRFFPVRLPSGPLFQAYNPPSAYNVR